MESAESTLDFAFAFNDLNFSDRTLHIIIVPDSLGTGDDPTPKRPRLDQVQGSNGDEQVQSNELSPSSSTRQMMKAIHISTPILSAKSQFFFKLFSNGMAESKEQLVTMQIQESEQVAFMDMLKFMYTNTLSSTTPSALLDVLMVADKYQFALCMKHCTRLLRDLPMTYESALFYLDLPSTILMAIKDMVQPLVDAAKEFLVSRFRDIKRCCDEMLNLPLAAIEVVLSSNDLKLTSEDQIYDFVMKWARRHYTDFTERQVMLTTHLHRLVRLPFMSFTKLNELLNCSDIDYKDASRLVIHALSFDTHHPSRPQFICSRLQERAYKHRPVKVMRFNVPYEECVVYLDLTHEECTRDLSSGYIGSTSFCFAGQTYALLIGCLMRNSDNSSLDSPGIFMCAFENKSVVSYAIEFSSRMMPSKEFAVNLKAEYPYTAQPKVPAYGCRNLFNLPWETFIADDSPYFINGLLHLRIVIKINKGA